MKFQIKYNIELEGLNLKQTWIYNKKPESQNFFFLVEQISSDGHNMKIEEGFESKINKKLTMQ